MAPNLLPRLMNKKLLVSLLVILTIASYQNLYAHDENRGIEKREAERKGVEEQEARENWDDFMNAIKKQETKTNADSEPGQRNPSREQSL
jgi:hypothetical protein